MQPYESIFVVLKNSYSTNVNLKEEYLNSVYTHFLKSYTISAINIIERYKQYKSL